MKRSAQPLPSGARTKAGELSMPRKADLLLEVIGHVLRSVIVAHGQTAGDRLGEPTEMLPHALADRLQRLEAGGPCMRVDADAFGGAMIDRDEHRGLAFAGDRRRQVGAPHRVDRLGDDGAVMVARPPRRADPRRRQQVILPHQPQHPAQSRCGSRHTAIVPRPCDGLRHGTGWRPARPGSPPSAPHPTSRRAARAAALGGGGGDRWR